MPTKLFFLGAVAPDATPTVTGSAVLPGTANLFVTFANSSKWKMAKTLAGAVPTLGGGGAAWSTLAITTQQRGNMYLQVGPQLQAQTIAAQNWLLQSQFTEGNGAANLFRNVCIYVWRPSTNAVVGRIYDSLTNVGLEFGGGVEQITLAGAAVTCQLNDRIVIELWGSAVQSMATSYAVNVGTSLGDAAGTHYLEAAGTIAHVGDATVYTVNVDGGITPAGAVVRLATQRLAAAIASAGVVVKVGTFFRNLSGAIANAGAAVKMVTKRINASHNLYPWGGPLDLTEAVAAGVAMSWGQYLISDGVAVTGPSGAAENVDKLVEQAGVLNWTAFDRYASPLVAGVGERLTYTEVVKRDGARRYRHYCVRTPTGWLGNGGYSIAVFDWDTDTFSLLVTGADGAEEVSVEILGNGWRRIDVRVVVQAGTPSQTMTMNTYDVDHTLGSPTAVGKVTGVATNGMWIRSTQLSRGWSTKPPLVSTEGSPVPSGEGLIAFRKAWLDVRSTAATVDQIITGGTIYGVRLSAAPQALTVVWEGSDPAGSLWGWENADPLVWMSESGVNPRFRLDPTYINGTTFGAPRMWFHNGTAAVQSVAPSAPVADDNVRLVGHLFADGSVQIFASYNGAAWIAGPRSAAPAGGMPSAWGSNDLNYYSAPYTLIRARVMRGNVPYTEAFRVSSSTQASAKFRLKSLFAVIGDLIDRPLDIEDGAWAFPAGSAPWGISPRTNNYTTAPDGSTTAGRLLHSGGNFTGMGFNSRALTAEVLKAEVWVKLLAGPAGGALLLFSKQSSDNAWVSIGTQGDMSVVDATWRLITAEATIPANFTGDVNFTIRQDHIGTTQDLAVWRPRMWVERVQTRGVVARAIGPRVLSGAVAIAGAVVRSASFLRSLVSGVTPSGAVVRQPRKFPAGGIAMAGVLTRLRGYSRLLAGVITPSGAVTRRLARGVAGTIALSGVLATTYTPGIKAVAGSIAMSGSLTRRLTRLLVASVALSGVLALVRQYARQLAGSSALAGSLTRFLSRVVAGATTLSGVLNTAKAFLRSYAGTVASAGEVSRRPGKVTGGTVSMAGTLVRGAVRLMAGLLAPAGALSRLLSRALSGGILSAGEVPRTRVSILNVAGTLALAGVALRTGIVKAPAGTIAPSGSLTRRVLGRLVSGSIALGGSLGRMLSRGLAGTVALSGAVVRQSQKVVAGTIALVGAVARVVTHRMSGTIAPAGSVSLTAMVRLSGTVTLAGGVVREVRKSLTAQIAPSGVVQRGVQTLKALGSAILLVGVLSRVVTRNMGGSVSLAGALSRSAQRSFAGSIALEGGVVRQLVRQLAGLIAPSAVVQRPVLKTIGGSVTMSGAVVTFKLRILPLSGVVASEGSLARGLFMRLAGSLGMSGLLARLNTKALSGTVTFRGAVFPWKVGSGIDWTATDGSGLRTTAEDRSGMAVTATDASGPTMTEEE